MDFTEKDIVRFWRRVGIAESADECWPWLSLRKRVPKKNYGRFALNGKQVGTHRLAYFMFHGIDPDDFEGMLVCHTCDNPPCCNPNHLYIGTVQQNTLDRVRRSAVGSKLTPRQVREIRKFLNKGYAQIELAEIYGVSFQTISHLARGYTYKHIK